MERISESAQSLFLVIVEWSRYTVVSRCNYGGVNILRSQDTSDPRQFGTSAEVSDA